MFKLTICCPPFPNVPLLLQHYQVDPQNLIAKRDLDVASSILKGLVTNLWQRPGDPSKTFIYTKKNTDKSNT